MAGWSPEQSLYQFKCHLSKTALQAFRLFSKEDRANYALALAAMKKEIHLHRHRRASWNGISQPYARESVC